MAADNETILTSVRHTSAVAPVDVSGKTSATFTVKYGYSGTVDLSHGLDIVYNTSLYSSASASFPSGSVATVGGAAVAMTVTYQKVGKRDTIYYSIQYQGCEGCICAAHLFRNRYEIN